MSDKKKRKDKDLSNEKLNRNLDYERCPKHGITFRKGSSCYKCDAEK